MNKYTQKSTTVREVKKVISSYLIYCSYFIDICFSFFLSKACSSVLDLKIIWIYIYIYIYIYKKQKKKLGFIGCDWSKNDRTAILCISMQKISRNLDFHFFGFWGCVSEPGTLRQSYSFPFLERAWGLLKVCWGLQTIPWHTNSLCGITASSGF